MKGTSMEWRKSTLARSIALAVNSIPIDLEIENCSDLYSHLEKFESAKDYNRYMNM